MTSTEIIGGSITFPGRAHGDLTIAWDEAKHEEMVQHIQALMDKGVTFHRIESVETGRLRKKVKTTAVALSGTGDIGGERKLLIKDADIANIVSAGLAEIATFEGVAQIEAVGGKVKSAAEAAKTDTVAVAPAKGG